jgi:anti-anti-sigma factor
VSTVAGFKVVRYGPSTYFLGGELDLAAAPVLTDAIAESVDAGGAIVLDLDTVTFIDSAGIRALLQVADLLGDDGCILLHAPQRRVLRVLEIVGIGSAPNIHILERCPSDTHPNDFLEWQTPADIAGEFAELRRLGGNER